MVKQSYLEQPIISNPVRWLGLDNFHSSRLKLKDYYNTESLKCNPLAEGLTDTKMDGTRRRFPKGQMIRLGLDSNSGISPEMDSMQKEHFLVPFVEDPRIPRVLSPSHYILNNKRYIEYIVKTKQWRRFVPLKFTFKNGSRFESKLHILPNLEETIKNILINNVENLLRSRQYEETKVCVINLSEGFVVDSKISEKFLEVSNSLLTISVGNLGIKGPKDQFSFFVPYRGNSALSNSLIKLALFTKR